MNGSFPPPLAAGAARYLLWPAFWTAIVLLSAACLFLLRSRWAKSHPLNRYILLSILAHLVLLGCAATVHVVLAPPPPRQMVQVAIIDDGAADESPNLPQQTDESIHEDANPPRNHAPRASLTAGAPTASPLLLSDADHAAPPTRTTSTTPSAPDLQGALTPREPSAVADVPSEPPSASHPTHSEARPLTSQQGTSQVHPSSDPHLPPNEAAELPEDELPDEQPPHAPHTADQAPDPHSHQDALNQVDLQDGPLDAPSPDATLPPARQLLPPATTASDTQPGPEGAGGQPGLHPLANSSHRRATGVVAGPASLPSDEGETPSGAPSAYAWRALDARRQHALAAGGSDETEAAVEAALDWLARSQSSGGNWDARRFGAGQERWIDGHNRQGAGARADAGVTGLALLAFLGAGYTHRQGDYQSTVAAALEYLLRIQAPSGHLAGDADPYAFMYCHGMASLALSEAYAMTGDKALEPAVRKAIGYTLSAQHTQTGGWRYRPGELGDTSQLGWQLMALASAEQAGVQIPPQSYVLAARFLDSVASGASGGLASYRPQERPTRSMTAEALVCRYLLAARASAVPGLTDRDGTRFLLSRSAEEEAATFLLQELPGTSQDNAYYWYYGSMAMYQAGGEAWEQWNQALTATLLARQRRAGHLAGSWDPDRVWGSHGGRVYSTAMCALCLEVYYRYLPLYRLAQSARRGQR